MNTVVSILLKSIFSSLASAWRSASASSALQDGCGIQDGSGAEASMPFGRISWSFDPVGCECGVCWLLKTKLDIQQCDNNVCIV